MAACSVASRRQCENIIAEGRVSINGQMAKLGDSVDPDNDAVLLDDTPVEQDQKVYVVLNKPKGVITSVKDTHDRKTVLDCISGVTARIFPIGRLDMDVTGTLLLTNDGELSHKLAHPSFEVDKVYHAWVSGKMNKETARKMSTGIELDDGMTAPAQVTIIKTNRNATLIRLVIHEGRKRIVKRMCAAAGHPVRDLRRTEIAGIESGDLIPGEWRHLSPNEVSSLKNLAQLPH